MKFGQGVVRLRSYMNDRDIYWTFLALTVQGVKDLFMLLYKKRDNHTESTNTKKFKTFQKLHHFQNLKFYRSFVKLKQKDSKALKDWKVEENQIMSKEDRRSAFAICIETFTFIHHLKATFWIFHLRENQVKNQCRIQARQTCKYMYINCTTKRGAVIY